MAIAAHPGDAFFAMGAPVAVATHFGGQGSLLSLSSGEKGSSTIPAEQYGSLQREAAHKAAALISAKAVLLQYPDGEIPVGTRTIAPVMTSSKTQYFMRGFLALFGKNRPME